MKGSLYTICYAAVLGTVCALLLTGVGRLTAESRANNEEAEKARNVLAVLGVPFEEDSSSQELLAVFKENVREEEIGGLAAYVYESKEADRTAAIPLAGPGLWGPVRGYLALAADMKTIRGIAFHEQDETPGLGGQIASGWFRDQFKGKSIEGPAGEVGIRIVRSGAKALNEVDAITGATMTCEKVEAIINAAIARIAKEQETDVR